VVNQILVRFDPHGLKNLPRYIGITPHAGVCFALVSSQLDCDRMDYLLRHADDRRKYGMYDLEWVLHALRIDEQSDSGFMLTQGLYSVEEYLRLLLRCSAGYFHRTLRSAEAARIQR
jgi:HD superfamily phosphohydrolase